MMSFCSVLVLFVCPTDLHRLLRWQCPRCEAQPNEKLPLLGKEFGYGVMDERKYRGLEQFTV